MVSTFRQISAIEQIARQNQDGRAFSSHSQLYDPRPMLLNNGSFPCSKRTTELKFANMLRSFTDKLNHEQRLAFKLTHESTSPVVVVHGPPGTGKTYLLAVVAWSHAMMRQQILVVTPSNEAANSFASHLLSIQRATPQLQRAPIIRYHARNVEHQIMITLNASNPTVTVSPLPKYVSDLRHGYSAVHEV